MRQAALSDGKTGSLLPKHPYLHIMSSFSDLRIVFMGTPEFAVSSLRALVENAANVVGVVTMPDKPKGRHQDTLQPSAVKVYAQEADIPVLQPVNLKDEAFIAELEALRPDLGIVVAFRMLPEVVWGMPRLGTFNLHASLLPQYRGAAPINWAVINGDKQTGVTTFFLKHAIDTGNIIAQRRIPITEEDDAGTIHDRLMQIGATLVVDTVRAIVDGTVTTSPQQESDDLRPAPKIFKETCRIDWKQPGRSVFNFIRGLAPYPAAWTVMRCGDKLQEIKIFKAGYEEAAHQLTPGSVCMDGDLRVAVPDGFIRIDMLQVAGRKRMSVADFLRGFHAEGELAMD